MIMIQVYSPAVDLSYDFQIDETSNIGDSIRGMVRMISRQAGSDFDNDISDVSLYETDRKCELDKGRAFAEYGIRSGAMLILI